MPKGPAARVHDMVSHLAPSVLNPGPGSPNVVIGHKPAWRGVPAAAAATLQAMKATADSVVESAVAAKNAATGPALPTAIATEQATKAAMLANLNASFVAIGGGADTHSCVVPSPMPPHGPGVVLDGSQTVVINNLAACRKGDTVTEPLGPPNKIVMGCKTVMIGG